MKRQGKLLGWMRENEKTQQDLANLIGVSLTQVNKKLNGRSDFSLTECKKICIEWNLSMDIFE